MHNEFSRQIRIDHIDGKDKRETITATVDECAALAKRFGIVSVDSLAADVVVTRQSDRMTYHVTGVVTAKTTQSSVVSAKNVEKTIKDSLDAWFVDQTHLADFNKIKNRKQRDESADEIEMTDEKDDPEPILNGAIDIGEVAAQYLGLSLDPYPRADDEENGDYIESKEEEKPNPFAALADIKVKDAKKD